MNRIDLDTLCDIADVYMARQEEQISKTMNADAAHALCERVAPEFLTLIRALFRIAAVYDELGSDERRAQQRLTQADFAVWETFVRPFDKSMFSAAEIACAERLRDVWPCDRTEWENRLCGGYEWELAKQAMCRVGAASGDGVGVIEAAQALCKRLTMPSAEYEIGRAAGTLAACFVAYCAENAEQTEKIPR